MLKFDSEQTIVMLNPRAPDIQTVTLYDIPGLVWFATSGTTAKAGEQTWVGLTRNALLASAAAVNAHLNVDASDRWANPLPHFHVGGAGIIARAYLSKSKSYDFQAKWNAEAFVQFLVEIRATLTALVPTQVYDIVKARLQAPESLRAVIVGGGRLSLELYNCARQLGWPLLASFGMTECASQIATASLSNGMEMHLLSHIQAKCTHDGFLCIKSPSLLSMRAIVTAHSTRFEDPLIDGWYQTHDVVHIEGKNLTVLGRASDFVKIGGESVNTAKLQSLWEKICFETCFTGEAAIQIQSDDRLGAVISLITTAPAQTQIELFNTQVMPFERIRNVQTSSNLPKTPLGKIKSFTY